jgi:hypothetical protein
MFFGPDVAGGIKLFTVPDLTNRQGLAVRVSPALLGAWFVTSLEGFE